MMTVLQSLAVVPADREGVVESLLPAMDTPKAHQSGMRIMRESTIAASHGSSRRGLAPAPIASRAAFVLAVACGGLGLIGCQVDVGGQTLPSPYYLQDDIQYFPAGPEFKLSKEAAALKAATPVTADDCCN